MKKSFIFIFILLSGFLQLSFANQADSVKKSIIGSWSGILDIPKTNGIKIVFTFKYLNDTLKSILKSPDQSSRVFPADSVFFENKRLFIVVKSLDVKFDGIYVAADSSISGTFTQNGQNLDLILKPFKLNRPQEPKPPFPYLVKEVEFKNQKANIVLSGTLTMPLSGGPFPVVVMISGSGPEDRNEEIFDHKPFWVIADYLTRQGIAVLRYDDRGTGKSTGKYSGSSIDDFSTDAVAAIEFLKTENKIDTGKIGLIGHSEGGIIAPMIASQNKDVAFIVMMAGPGLPGDQLLMLQAEKIFKSMKMSQDIINKDRQVKKKIFSYIKKGQDSSVIAKKIVREYSKLDDSDLEKLGISKKALNIIVASYLNPEISSLICSEPAVYIKRVKCPVLALNGENDMQVPSKENLKAVGEALKAGGNTNYTIKELWYLNHLFQTCETGSPDEYGKIEETISPLALEAMSDWIKQIVSKP